MHEFSTMYSFFKGIADSPEKIKDQLPPTEECTNDSYSTHYLEMKSSSESDSNNNELPEKSSDAACINYSNVDDFSDTESVDVIDGPSESIEMQLMNKRDSKDLLNNLNSMQIKEEDEKEITNELKISEDNYYDSNANNGVTKNGVADDFSNECSDVLENCSQTETASLSPSVNSVPSSSDNQQSLQESDYLIQPSNRPVTNSFGDYITHPSNRPIDDCDMSHDYMNQPAVRGNLSSKRESSHLRLYFKKKSESICEDGAGYSKIHELSSPTKSVKSNGTLKRQGSDASKKSVDDELVEIINDFKNNVFTIQEVEELVSAWKNRNDVKKSFKDQQEQLQKMRETYEKIQQKIKESTKRPSPFERMKRLFLRKHDKEVPLVLPVNLTGDPKFPIGSSGQRPTSTLSLHSASSTTSSGRMSTSSQVSVGDSGTHSDHEDRRNHHHSFRIGQTGSLIENYIIPPTPRPVSVSTPSSTPIEEKGSIMSFPTSQNTTPIDTPDHYILFPSNLPVLPSPPYLKKSHENSFTTFKGKQ